MGFIRNIKQTIADVQTLAKRVSTLEAQQHTTSYSIAELTDRINSLEHSNADIIKDCSNKCDSVNTQITELKGNLETITKNATTLKADFDRTKKLVVYKRKKVQEQILSSEE